MLLRKYQINNTLRFYATLSALQLLCFNKNPDDGDGWNSERNRTNLLQESENVFVDLFPEQSILSQDDMNLRKILEESTFQSWRSHLARKSLVEDLIRFDRNDNDRKITLYPLDIQNETQDASNSSVSLSSYDRRPFSLFQLPNDTRNFDSLAAYGLDERKPSSFNDFPTQDVFLDNSFYDLHLNTISNASTSSASPSSSSSHRKSKKNPLKKDAVLPNINRIRRQDIDFFNRYRTESNEAGSAAAAGPAMREQGTLTMMTNSIFKQDVDLGYTFSNYNPSYTMSSIQAPIEEAEKVQVIQNLNDSKITESNEQGIDIGYLLSLSASNSTDNKTSNVTSNEKLLKIDEDRKLAEILYEQDIDLGYILSPTKSKESYPPKVVDQTAKKISKQEKDSDDVSDLWAGIPFKIDNETGEYIRLPFEDIFKDFIDENDPKDETASNQETPNLLDIEATIEDIANLFTPSSDFYDLQDTEAPSYVHDNLYLPKHNQNLSYESQSDHVYGYNSQRTTDNFYQTNLEPTRAQNMYEASGGTHETDNNSGVHNDAYLDTILSSECFKMMTANSNESSTAQHHNSPMNGSASGGSKNSDKPPDASNSIGSTNVANFMDLSCGSAGSSLGSLGSESLPSTSDGEWGEGSESGHDYHRSNFYGPYDYSSNNINLTKREMPVAQKKYHMFGKRFLQDEISHNTSANSKINTLHQEGPKNEFDGKENSTFEDFEDEIKANGNLGNISKLLKKNVKTERDKFKSTDENLVHHNHTYALSHSQISDPFERDGSEYDDGQSEEGHLTRDEKRARNLNIPIPVHEIINLPMDEFNECISKYDLSENQLSLIRDIRRRGKNKVAAQNCRKRKLDTITTLESEVEEVRRRKEKLHNEKTFIAMEKKRIANKFATLHKHIFHYLKDDDGKPCSSSKFKLQQASDGSMYLLPREESKQDPDCYMSLLMGEASSSGTCRDRSRMKESFSRTNVDGAHSITQL